MSYSPRCINITLYGASNNTYSNICHNPMGLDQTIRGIHVKLNGTIVLQNRKEIESLYEISQELEIPIEMETHIYLGQSERCGVFNEEKCLSCDVLFGNGEI